MDLDKCYNFLIENMYCRDIVFVYKSYFMV